MKTSSALWEFKHQPNSLEEMVLNSDVRKKLQKVLIEYPNIILNGPPGVGKSLFVSIYKKVTGFEFLKINCSDETGIDNIREKVKSFATALGMSQYKIVYLNESDFLSIQSQAMLRDLMEQVQAITRFVLACNYGEKLIPELCSRCQWIDVNNPPAEDIFKHCCSILDKENIQYKRKTVIDIVKKCYPDIRNTVVSLKENISNGILPNDIKVTTANEVFASILEAMTKKDPEAVRKVLRSNAIDYVGLYKFLYDTLMGESSVFKDDAQAIVLVGEHCYRDSMVPIKEINFMHCYFRMLKNGAL